MATKAQALSAIPGGWAEREGSQAVRTRSRLLRKRQSFDYRNEKWRGKPKRIPGRRYVPYMPGTGNWKQYV